MFIKQVMARPVPAHPKWKYSLNRESMILFFTRKYYMATSVPLKRDDLNISY